MRRNDIGSYLYWSDRRIKEIVSDNAIDLEGKVKWSLKGGVPGIGLELGNKERNELTRHEKAVKIEKVVGDRAIEAFDSPEIALFAKGVARLNIARFVGGPAGDKGLLFHVRTQNSDGQQVDLVLFGSMENLPGRYFRPSDGPEDGWYSSAWYAIAELLESHGTKNTSQWDDPESLSVEALKIAVSQGFTGAEADYEGKPWTRGYTLGHTDGSEWFAQIYTDVVLTDGRWTLGGALTGAKRILIGAPAWVRTTKRSSVTRYADLRKAEPGSLARGRRFLRDRRGSVQPS